MIVPGKIAHRQQVDTRLLLLIPVTSTQFTPYCQQFFAWSSPPNNFLALFSARDAGQREETEGVIKNCHYMPLNGFLVFSRPDVYIHNWRLLYIPQAQIIHAEVKDFHDRKHLKTLQALRIPGSLAPLRRRCIRRNPPCLTSLAIWNNALASGYLCVRASRYALPAGILLQLANQVLPQISQALLSLQ